MTQIDKALIILAGVAIFFIVQAVFLIKESIRLRRVIEQDDQLVLFNDSPVASNLFLYRIAYSRLFEILVSLLFLLIFSPIFLLIAFLISIDSDGPIVFRQRRLGLSGNTFILYKFRTMNVLERVKEKPGSRDPRITRIGVILRRTGLDQLPQIVSVLRGDMSLFGPVALPLFFTERLPPGLQNLYNEVKPGLYRSMKKSVMSPIIDSNQFLVDIMTSIKYGKYSTTKEVDLLRAEQEVAAQRFMRVF